MFTLFPSGSVPRRFTNMWASSSVKVVVLFVAPALVVLMAYLAAPWVADLPPELAGLQKLGPVAVLAFAAAIAIAFNRGRVLLAVLALSIAYTGLHLAWNEDTGGHLSLTVYAAITILLPLNLGALALLKERGLSSRWGARRLGAIVVQATAVLALATGRPTAFTQAAWGAPTGLAWLAASPIPPLGVLALALGFGGAVVATCMRRSAIEAGIAGAIVAVALAVHDVTVPLVFEVFIAFGGMMLAVGVLQDTYRLAFRDELTGLPSRRALNERLLALGDRYTIAMVDVDHFKQFNDRWGHDVGDQVLKMVAAHLERVAAGGRGYRYGGEEFTLVFSGRSIRDVLPHVEAVREAIEHYALAIRAPDRPKQGDEARRGRSGRSERQSVSVTVSIGVAEPSGRNDSPDAVLRAADAALYRAKNKGRNQISR
ncbi:MAG: GGDEF domain-containing protein [Burkholderiales bacterium]|nr:GGDEF domain-containing protein [Burkholderiales bacterium]